MNAINWWYGFRSGIDAWQGRGPFGTVYYWTPTPLALTYRYLTGR